MGKRANKNSGRYRLSAKPLSRKKKLVERRERKARNQIADELPPADMCRIEPLVLSTSQLNDVDFHTSHSATENSEAPEATAAVDDHQQEPRGIAEQIAADFMDDVEMDSSDNDTRDDSAVAASQILGDHEEFPDAVISDESLPGLTIERVPETKEEESGPPGIRHIVDFAHMFAELHRKFDNHNPVYRCTLDGVQLVSTLRVGLKTKFLFKCGMCLKEENIMSEPEESSILSVNESAVAGAISIGVGYSQAQELFGAMNVSFMSADTYQSYHDKISTAFNKAAEEEMRVAGEEEKRLAIERGDVKNGVPHIPVIADGSWLQRSYRTGNYNSPSGVGVIVGFHTKKVLFLGVRNKYCTICRLAEKKKETPKEHTCFKNWGSNQSSSSMESSAVSEGFMESMKMNGLVYSSLIADGDSSVYKRILECNPYPDTYVKKIECTNHLLRNLCRKIKDVQNIKVKPGAKAKVKTMSKSKRTITDWKDLVKGSTLRIRTAVTKASEYRRAEKVDLSVKVERLRKDLVNIPSHVFGEHKKCAELAYFCDGTPKDGEENIVPILVELGLYEKVCDALTQVSWHGESLLYNVTSNAVENYNAVVSKFVGGKRIHFGKRNSYNARVAGSVVQFNSQESYAKLSAAMDKEPTAMVQQLQAKRKAYNLKRLATAQHKKKEPRQERSAASSSGKKSNSDPDYGLNCNQPDISEAEFEAQRKIHFESLADQQADRLNIEVRTRDQSDSGNWRLLRKKLLTASNFGKVCRMRPTTSSASTVKAILYPQELSLPALQYGKQSEPKARQQFEEENGLQVAQCGLFIDSEHCYLAASPDGLIDDDGVLEIKCPFSARDVTPEQAIAQRLGDVHRVFNKSDPDRMNENHPYFYQVQGQLHIAQRDYCAFVLWTPKETLDNSTTRADDKSDRRGFGRTTEDHDEEQNYRTRSTRRNDTSLQLP